jgi:hypothetical protein
LTAVPAAATLDAAVVATCPDSELRRWLIFPQNAEMPMDFFQSFRIDGRSRNKQKKICQYD